MNQQRRIFGIKLWEIASFCLIYFLLSLFYYVTLWLNRYGYDRPNKDNVSLFDLGNYLYDGGFQYIIMFVSTILVWLLIFRWLKHWKLWQRLLLHFIGLPFFVLMAQQFYYWVSDFLVDHGHLTGSGTVWDIYIPSLIYLIQFSLFHAYEYYVLNQRKQRAELELRHSALKSELSALKAQLNPHFLYNVFNTINASVPPEMESTREMIADLADLFRYQLKASKEDLVPLADEIAFVKQYLELEKKRFEDRLTVEFDVPEELLKEAVPPMIIQPLVENAVKHGISPIVEGGSVSVRVKRQDGKLHIEIKDTGVGTEDKVNIFKKGVGLTNTSLRLEKMYDSKLILSDNQPRGLIIQFAL